MRFTVDRLDHLVLTCAEIELTAAWYQRVLGMEREEFGQDRRTALKFGGQKINLRQKTVPGTVTLCFVTAVRPDDIVGHLHGLGIQIEQGPVATTGALGPMWSVSCRDPDGNLIEIATYLSL